jgi:hypothetical protein
MSRKKKVLIFPRSGKDFLNPLSQKKKFCFKPVAVYHYRSVQALRVPGS